MHRFTLRFSTHKHENDFQKYYFQKTLLQIRIALGLAMVLYASYSFLDPWFFVDRLDLILLIRIFVSFIILLMLLKQ